MPRRFEQPPAEALAWGLGKHDAVLDLIGGRQVVGDHLLGVYEERFGTYVNNLRTGTAIELRHNDVVFYVRGGEHRAAGFDQLRRLAFLAARQVEMTAADGSSVVADLDDDGDRKLVGLSGQYDRGFFDVGLEKADSVTFERPAGTE